MLTGTRSTSARVLNVTHDIIKRLLIDDRAHEIAEVADVPNFFSGMAALGWPSDCATVLSGTTYLTVTHAYLQGGGKDGEAVGANALGDAVEANKGLRMLDLSFNSFLLNTVAPSEANDQAKERLTLLAESHAQKKKKKIRPAEILLCN